MKISIKNLAKSNDDLYEKLKAYASMCELQKFIEDEFPESPFSELHHGVIFSTCKQLLDDIINAYSECSIIKNLFNSSEQISDKIDKIINWSLEVISVYMKNLDETSANLDKRELATYNTRPIKNTIGKTYMELLNIYNSISNVKHDNVTDKLEALYSFYTTIIPNYYKEYEDDTRQLYNLIIQIHDEIPVMTDNITVEIAEQIEQKHTSATAIIHDRSVWNKSTNDIHNK